MGTVARKISSIPVRTSGETWKVIVNLISTGSSTARSELESINGIAASIIADEFPKNAPIIVIGAGPRVRIYCLYGEDAITGDDQNESTLATNPTGEDWQLYFPCPADDIEWLKKALGKVTNRAFVYDQEKGLDNQQEDNKKTATKLTINVDNFLNK